MREVSSSPRRILSAKLKWCYEEFAGKAGAMEGTGGGIIICVNRHYEILHDKLSFPLKKIDA